MPLAPTLDHPVNQQSPRRASHRQRAVLSRGLPYRITGLLAVMAVALTPATSAGGVGPTQPPQLADGQYGGLPGLDSAHAVKGPSQRVSSGAGSARPTKPSTTGNATAGTAGNATGGTAGNATGGTAGGRFGPTDTRFGITVQAQASMSWTSSFSLLDRRYGGLEVYRGFYPGAPSPWPGAAGYGRRSVVVSFHYAPRDVLTGRHDAALAKWFRTAPRGYPIYWIYKHEPEDDVERGSFTATDYRAAWRHIRAVQRSTGRMDLRATLALMCWTIGGSDRNWRDYYPGGDVIDVMAWDCYNWGVHSSPVRYASPAEIFGKAADLSAALGKPFGIAETGSARLPSDLSGVARARWLRATASYLDQRNAAFVCYFDVQKRDGVDYRLTDAPSRLAWAQVVSG